MADRAYDKEFFKQWVCSNRRRLQLDEEELARRVNISVANVLMWEVGNSRWMDLTKGYREALEKIFGGFPLVEKSAQYEFREASGTTFIDNVTPQIEETYRESDCPKCNGPVLIRDNGRCNECESNSTIN